MKSKKKQTGLLRGASNGIPNNDVLVRPSRKTPTFREDFTTSPLHRRVFSKCLSAGGWLLIFSRDIFIQFLEVNLYPRFGLHGLRKLARPIVARQNTERWCKESQVTARCRDEAKINLRGAKKSVGRRQIASLPTRIDTNSSERYRPRGAATETGGQIDKSPFPAIGDELCVGM